jgi:hypothetical protein
LVLAAPGRHNDSCAYSVNCEDKTVAHPDFSGIIRVSVVAITLLAGACVTSHVIVGKVRPAISSDQVQLYLHPPQAKYEQIAILDTSSRHSLSITAQGKTDAVIKRLKGEAAKLGANGILLQDVGDQEIGSGGVGVGTGLSGGHGSVGLGFSSSDMVYAKSGRGIAIYVDADPAAK